MKKINLPLSLFSGLSLLISASISGYCPVNYSRSEGSGIDEVTNGCPENSSGDMAEVTDIKKTQYIGLKTGWNIVSFGLVPDNPDLKSIFLPLINDNSLVKVQDESGNSMEDYGIFGSWTNNIGNMSLTEGYKVKVNCDCGLSIEGYSGLFPFKVPLKSGWNIMGFPGTKGIGAMTVMQPLINRGSLIKVQDETGNSVEDMGIFGGWTNNIGIIRPGKGYKVKVAVDDTVSLFSETGIDTGTFVDHRDGTAYDWVQIGDHTWMAGNLTATTFNDGTDIPLLTNGLKSATLASSGYCFYNDDPETCSGTYGALYNWDAVNTGKLCPSGWHIPSDEEWTAYADYLISCGYNWDSSTTGNKIAQSMASPHFWDNSPTEGSPGYDPSGNNSTGFSGLPCGIRGDNNSYYGMGSIGYYWSGTEESSAYAWSRYLAAGSPGFGRININKEFCFSVRCVRNPVTTASVTTAPPQSYTSSSAILGGEVISDGGSEVTERGVCYGITQNPAMEGSKITLGSGMGAFNGKINGLTANTTYYARAYAINIRGTVYGEQFTFTTSSKTTENPTGYFTDNRDGRTYQMVQIGNQWWMAENLSWMSAVSPPAVPKCFFDCDNYTDPHYYVLSYNGSDLTEAGFHPNYAVYGTLYNWYAAVTACPAGWHLPSDDEWKRLEMTLGMTQAQADSIGRRGTDQGSQMKTTSGWYENGNGSNSSGLSILPGGVRSFNGGWGGAPANVQSYFYTSDNYSRKFVYGYSTVERGSGGIKTTGMYVRCVRD